MSKNTDPAKQMVELLERQLKAWTAGMEAFAKAWEEQQSGSGATQDTAGMAGVAERLGKAARDLWSIQAKAMERFLQNLPESQRERLDSQTFSQFGRLAEVNWNAQIERLADTAKAMAEKIDRADPDELGGLLASTVEEIGKDIASLGPADFTPDLEPLSRAMGALAAGNPDPQSLKTVQRLYGAMLTKLKYGLEYYADPEQTPVGQTPRDVVKRYGRFTLYRYRLPDRATPGKAPPVLLVYSVINKPYILDLVPGFSFVEHLLREGLDVYLIDWGETKPGDPTTLDDLIEPGISDAVSEICRITGRRKVSLFGHCIGGNLALLYAALHPGRVSRLVALTTPITPARGGVVALWTNRQVFDVDAIVDEFGLMPAKLIRYTFMALKPYYEMMKWKMFVEKLHDDQVMALFEPVDRWANDNVDIPAEVFRKFIKEVFHEERFARGQTEIHGKPAPLSAVTCPVLCLAANRDWIVPEESARVLVDFVGTSKKQYVTIEGAHVGIMIDPRLRPLWKRMSDFLKGKG